MNVLLLGGSGLLGHALASAAPASVTLTAPPHAALDITDRRSLNECLERTRPQVILNAAAFTRVDDAEQEQERAHLVNATAVAAIADEAALCDALLVHFSTDYVFAGSGTRPWRENDPVAPVNAYGATKLAGERVIAARARRALVVRTQWLFGEHGRCLPLTMLERARRSEPARVVDDQVGRPTYAPDLAAATWRLVEQQCVGTVHIANAGEATWFDVARRVYAAEQREALVSRCATTDFPTPAKRPRYSVLDTSMAASLGVTLPDWKDAIDRFLLVMRER